MGWSEVALQVSNNNKEMGKVTSGHPNIYKMKLEIYKNENCVVSVCVCVARLQFVFPALISYKTRIYNIRNVFVENFI